MNTYIKTLLSEIGDQVFPRTRVDAVYLEDNTTKLNEELDARDERLADPKATPIDADFIGIRDSADANKLKKITWDQIKTNLETYFNTKYNNYTLPTASTTTLGGVKVDGTSITITDGVITANADELDTTTLGAVINGATGKTTPVDADSIGLVDSAASNIIKKLTWANVKATLKSYFDTLYQAVLTSGTTIKTINETSVLGSGNISVQPTLVSGTNIKTVNGNSVLGSGNLVITTGSTYTVYTATIPSSSWTGSSAPFSKVVAVSGILATDEPIVDLVLSGTYATDVTMRENWSKIYRIVTTDGNITCYADSVPSANINIQLVVVR